MASNFLRHKSAQVPFFIIIWCSCSSRSIAATINHHSFELLFYFANVVLISKFEANNQHASKRHPRALWLNIGGRSNPVGVSRHEARISFVTTERPPQLNSVSAKLMLEISSFAVHFIHHVAAKCCVEHRCEHDVVDIFSWRDRL